VVIDKVEATPVVIGTPGIVTNQLQHRIRKVTIKTEMLGKSALYLEQPGL